MALVEGHGYHLYFYCQCGVLKQFLRLNLHRWNGCKAHTDSSGRPLSEKLYPNLFDNHTMKKLQDGRALAELIKEYNDNELSSIGSNLVAMLDNLPL